jgi:hypothetical protein
MEFGYMVAVLLLVAAGVAGSRALTGRRPWGKSPAPLAGEEFARICHKFEGSYESLHGVCTGEHNEDDTRTVLEEWEIRISSSDAEALQQEWEKLMSRYATNRSPKKIAALDAGRLEKVANKWYRTLQQWGVQRDTRQQLPILKELYECYFFKGNPQIGDAAQVETPCWFFQDQVIERGRARVIHSQ